MGSTWFRARRRGPSLRLGSIPLFPSLPFFARLALPYTLHGARVLTHRHVMGLTGMGKSKLLASLAAQLILQGQPCAVIDPHADLAQDVLRLLVEGGYFRRPDARARVWYVDLAHPARFVPFNILRAPYPPYEIARNLVEATTRAWPSLAGGAAPQFENLLLAGAAVLIDNDLPLTALTPLLTDDAYRAALLRQVRDPQVHAFFTQRYERGARLNESTLRRAFLLTYPPPLRYSLGQRENRLEFRHLLDKKISLICSLGGLDAQTQRLLGCLLTVGFEMAALSRADLSPAARTPYHLILDEFSQFSAQSSVALERVLAQARKYGLYLTLAHQTFSQLAGSLQGALQNTTFLSFRLGGDDVNWGASRVGPYDPYQVNYWTHATAPQPARPVYSSKAEQQSQWAYALQRLKPREAFARVGERTIWLRTPPVPPATPQTRREVEGLIAHYSEELLTPRERVTEQAQPRAAPPDPPRLLDPSDPSGPSSPSDPSGPSDRRLGETAPRTDASSLPSPTSSSATSAAPPSVLDNPNRQEGQDGAAAASPGSSIGLSRLVPLIPHDLTGTVCATGVTKAGETK